MEEIDPSNSPSNDTDYRELYRLQDGILQPVFSIESEFYLTGGTCLSRFYQAKRYSDDLDFFSDNSPRFAFAVRNIRSALDKTYKLKTLVETKNFVRFIVDDILQIDFVNDIGYRFGEPVVTEHNFLIDNIENILANKLTAVIGRDNPKDVFDILLIYNCYSFFWKTILEAAHKKAGFSNEDLVVRLKSFPPQMFERIKCIDCGFLKHYESDIAEIIRAILETQDTDGPGNR